MSSGGEAQVLGRVEREGPFDLGVVEVAVVGVRAVDPFLIGALEGGSVFALDRPGECQDVASEGRLEVVLVLGSCYRA